MYPLLNTAVQHLMQTCRPITLGLNFKFLFKHLLRCVSPATRIVLCHQMIHKSWIRQSSGSETTVEQSNVVFHKPITAFIVSAHG